MSPLRRLTLAWLLAAGAPAAAMRLPIPPEYGRVVLDGGATAARVPPVAFDHWRHRARFTCRLCHVDVGFAMSAGATRVSAASNRAGFHCGACHDGRRVIQGRVVFPACSDARTLDPGGACARCHAPADPARLVADWEQFAGPLPRDPFGGVDWEKAEAEGRVRPLDHLEGLSLRRPPMRNDREVLLPSRGSWMVDVIFSHPKHAAWNGCEVCHPEIFPSAGGGRVKMTMLQIANGEYCGACHDRVAFPLADCQRCHVRPVR